MAIIVCTECGKEFSDKAAACPNCACPTPSMFIDSVDDTASFVMKIDDVFSITGRGVVITGTVKKGTLNTRDTVICANTGREFAVTGIEASRKILSQATEGMSIGVALADASKDDFASGWTIAKYANAHTDTNTIHHTQVVPQGGNEARCPKCGSTSLTGDKKGFGIGKAVVGATLFGGIGLVAGNMGAKKVRVTCMKCGYQFMAGKGA